MNKLFTKVAALTLGVAMAAGVGVAVGSESKAKAVEAATGSFDLSCKFTTSADGTGTECTSDGSTEIDTSAKFLSTDGSVTANISKVKYYYFFAGDASLISSSSITASKLFPGKNNTYKFASGSAQGSLSFSLSNTDLYVTSVEITGFSSKSGATITVDEATEATKTQTVASTSDTYTFIYSGTDTRTVSISVPSGKATNVSLITVNYASGDTPTPATQYNVTDSVENGSVSPSKVNEGATLTATITPDTGYELPATLTDVTMGGSSVVHSYNAETGVVTVENVTGDIVITGSCPEKQAPQPVDLPDGEYTASFPYANPFPTEIDVVDGQSAKVAALTSSISAVSTYDDTHSEYVIAANQSIEINNLTNGKINKVDIHIYQYKNFNVYVDDATDPVYTGDGTNAGNDAHIEVTTNALSKVKITGNGGDNGSRTFKVFDVKVYIVVASSPIAVEGVSLNAEEATMAVGATYNLTATVTPNGADNPAVTWSSNPASVATVSDDGVVTAVAAGDAVVTVTTVDGGFTDTFTAHVVEVNYGSESNPLTVEEARAALDVSGAATSVQKLWVYGEVYSSSYNSQYQDYTLWLKSSDGSENKYFEIYSGSINTAITEDDTQENALTGITVICNGYGKIHNNSVYELFKTNNEKPTIAKYEAPQPATYEVSFYQGDTELSSEEYAEGAKVTIPQPNAQLIPEGKQFDYWEHKESGAHYAPGVEFTVGTSSARFDAVYKDADWTDAQKTQLETALHGYLPPYFGELVEDLTTTENSAKFTVSGYHSGEFATKLGDGWDLVSDNNYMKVGDNYYLTASIYEYGVRLPVGNYSEFTFTYHEGSTWSAALLNQFATVLHGAVPHYDDSVKTLAYNADYNMFLMPEVDSKDAAEAQLATLCADWEPYSEGGFYYFDTEDGVGYAMGRVYQMSSTTYAAVLRFIQNAYEKDMADLFEEHLGIVPPYFDGFPTYIYHEGKFVCEYISEPSDLASELSYYREDIESYGFTSLGEARTEKIFVYNGGSSGEYNATIYAYGAYLQDGGLLIVEVYTLFNAYLGFNIYYQAMPVSISLSGEFKTTFEYGEQLDTTGMVVTATMSDETEQDVTSSAQFSGFDSLVEGEQTVTVTVGNASTTYTVTVNEKVLQKIDVTSEPTKVVYKVGEEFDPEGLEVTATYNGGDPVVLDLADVEISGFDSSTTGEKTVNVAFGGKTASFTVTVEQGYDADAFAKDLLDKVAPICANYDGKKNNKVALKTVWDTMSQLYSTLSNEEKAKVIAAAAKTDGTDLEKAMAFYNYACKKYGLTKFIEGRSVQALVTEHETGNSILPIVVIVASSVAAITAIGVVIALKRRKALLVR